MLVDVLAVVFVGLMVVDWLAAWILFRIDRAHPGIEALRARTQDAFLGAIAGSIVGLLGLFRLGRIAVGDIATWGLLLVLFLVSVPSVLWVIRYARNRVDDRPEPDDE